MRFSILHLLIFVSATALAATSLMFANDWWWSALLGIGLLLFMVMVILGTVARSKFAVGFSLCFFIYGATIYWSYSDELVPDDGKLPTTRLLAGLSQRVPTETRLSEAELAFPFPTSGGPIFVPAQDNFLRIGHFWFALLFGWLGGHFACWVQKGATQGGE